MIVHADCSGLPPLPNWRMASQAHQICSVYNHSTCFFLSNTSLIFQAPLLSSCSLTSACVPSQLRRIACPIPRRWRDGVGRRLQQHHGPRRRPEQELPGQCQLRVTQPQTMRQCHHRWVGMVWTVSVVVVCDVVVDFLEIWAKYLMLNIMISRWRLSQRDTKICGCCRFDFSPNSKSVLSDPHWIVYSIIIWKLWVTITFRS